MGRKRGTGGRVAAFATALSLTAGAALVLPRAATARTTIDAANAVTFTYDRLHPDRTVVGSAISYSRDASDPLTLTIAVVPGERTATFRAVLTNVSGTTVTFGRPGVRVDAIVVRDGGSRATWSVRASTLTGLAPGARRAITGVFRLGPSGRYTISAAARY